MPSTPDSAAHGAATGTVRRFWWRTSQPARLAIGCLGVLTVLATTGAVAFNGDAHPRERAGAGLDTAMSRGDSVQVTVGAVSDVDLFEGAEPVTGRIVRAQVAGLRPMSGCWVAESRAAAQDLLRGKDVRLIVRRDDASGSDRILVDVELPGGADYARTVVTDGAVQADLAARGELAPAETAAREQRRGLWAAGCVPVAVVATVSSVPPTSSSVPSPATTTTVPATTTPSVPPPPPAPPTTSSSAPAEEWEDSRLGKPCLLEGARRTTQDGYELVCSRNGKNQLRWRRGD